MTIKPTKFAADHYGSEREMLLAVVDAHNSAYERHRSVSNRPLRVLQFLQSNPAKWLDFSEFDPSFVALIQTGSVFMAAPFAYLMHMQEQRRDVYLRQMSAHGMAICKMLQYGQRLQEDYDKLAKACNALPENDSVRQEMLSAITVDLERMVAGQRPYGPSIAHTLGFAAIYDFFIHGFHTYQWKEVYKAAQTLHNPI